MTCYQDGIGRPGPRVVSSRMIKNKLLLVAIIAASILTPAAVRAEGISIQVGDRPFYSHGARYWDGDYEMIWVPGQYVALRHHWIHGQYVHGGTPPARLGIDDMTIDKTTSMTATADKLTTLRTNYEKSNIAICLFSMLTAAILTSCASDKTAESTTTTRQTTVTQPSATQTTTQTTHY